MQPSCRLATNSDKILWDVRAVALASLRRGPGCSRGSLREVSGGKCERFSPSSSVFLWIIVSSMVHVYPTTLLERWQWTVRGHSSVDIVCPTITKWKQSNSFQDVS
jgi:hypothetical protein